MTLKQEALNFIQHLQTLYFERRDMTGLLACMRENISLIGTGARDIFCGLQKVKNALQLEKERCAAPFTVTHTHYDVDCLSDDTCVVYGQVSASPCNPAIADICQRFTAVCTRAGGKMCLAHLHLSSPDNDLEPEYPFVKREAARQKEYLRRQVEKTSAQLQKRNRELEALTENIPGGVHQCRCDGNMTLLNMSDSFLKLVGYTRQEVQERFHNCFMNMIYAPDLEGVRAQMKEQLLQGDTLSLEYRIERSDGRLLGILDQAKTAVAPDGTKTFYCMLMDVTRQWEEREALRLSLERHQIIMDQTTDIIFEWNIPKDTLLFSSNWRKKFGYDAVHEEISKRIPLSANIHPDDMPAFVKIMEDSAAGSPYSETEFRIRDALGNYIWSRIRASVQYDMRHVPIKAVGVISDIDSDKKQRQLLQEQAQRDPLTNLYNKSAVRDLVLQKMASNEGAHNQALAIIDVDNFKRVNDTYGHLCGDSLLSDVARVLKKNFRSTDLVGRIGGDEFLIYLPAVAGKKQTEKKFEKLLAALHELRPEKDAPPISCSIGIALLPQSVTDYYALYKSADIALYKMKASGKDGFLFYDPEDRSQTPPSDLMKSAVGVIDSDLKGAGDLVGIQLAQYTFQMLYASIDINTAVEKLLEIVGRAYDVSRVYIFESSQDGMLCSNTFEWCNVGVEPEIQNLQNLSYQDDLGGYLQNFDDDYIFYCRDIRDLHPDLRAILAPQGICSLLQCAIMDDGVFKGYVGFDECRENRNWTKAQVSSLTLIANVLSTFLLKQRLKEQLARGD